MNQCQWGGLKKTVRQVCVCRAGASVAPITFDLVASPLAPLPLPQGLSAKLRSQHLIFISAGIKSPCAVFMFFVKMTIWDMASVKVEKELGQAVEKAISFNMAVIWKRSYFKYLLLFGEIQNLFMHCIRRVKRLSWTHFNLKSLA